MNEKIKVFDPFLAAGSYLKITNASRNTEEIKDLTSARDNVKFEAENVKNMTKSFKEEIDRLKETISTLEIRNGLLLKQIHEKKDVFQQQIIDENVDALSLEELKQKFVRSVNQNRQHVLITQQLEGKLRNYHELVIQVRDPYMHGAISVIYIFLLENGSREKVSRTAA